MRIRDRIIRSLGGYTAQEWQREIAGMRGQRTSLVLGKTRRLPVKVEARQTVSLAAYGEDPLVRENMAYRLAGIMMERGLIEYKVTLSLDRPPELVARAVVYPPEEETDA